MDLIDEHVVLSPECEVGSGYVEVTEERRPTPQQKATYPTLKRIGH